MTLAAGGISCVSICRMSHRVYPQNPAVPLQSNAVTTTQPYGSMHPGHNFSGRPNATGNVVAPVGGYGSRQQGAAGRQPPVRPIYPLPPTTQVHGYNVCTCT